MSLGQLTVESSILNWTDRQKSGPALKFAKATRSHRTVLVEQKWQLYFFFFLFIIKKKVKNKRTVLHGMIMWTGEGTLLDTAEPHHTLTIQKKIHIRHTNTSNINIYDWSHWSQGYGTLAQAYGGFFMRSSKTYKNASKILKRFDLNI